MKTTIINCDICGREMPQRGWEDTPQRLQILTNCTSRNPMERITKDGEFQSNTYTAEDVCQRCMKSLARIIADGIESLADASGEPCPPPANQSPEVVTSKGIGSTALLGFFALTDRFEGVDLQRRRSWPVQWRARLLTNKNERADYRITAWGKTAEEACVNLLAKAAEIDRLQRLKP